MLEYLKASEMYMNGSVKRHGGDSLLQCKTTKLLHSLFDLYEIWGLHALTLVYNNKWLKISNKMAVQASLNCHCIRKW